MNDNQQRVFADAYANKVLLKNRHPVSEDLKDTTLNYEALSGFLLVAGLGVGIALPLTLKYFLGP